MEQVFYMALGAVLALVGGIITQNFQNHVLKKKGRWRAFAQGIGYSD